MRQKNELKFKWWGISIGGEKQIYNMLPKQIGLVAIAGIATGYLVVVVWYLIFEIQTSILLFTYLIFCAIDILAIMQVFKYKKSKLTYLQCLEKEFKELKKEIAK